MTEIPEELENRIKLLTYRELVELFYKLTKSKRDEECLADGQQRVYAAPVVAEAAFSKTDKFLEYRLIAAPDPTFDGWISEDEITQSGKCTTCGGDCAGFSKSSICPVCGSVVDMT